MFSIKKFFLTLVIFILAGVGVVTFGKIAIDKLDLKGFTKDVEKNIKDIGDDVKDKSKELYKDTVKDVKEELKK